MSDSDDYEEVDSPPSINGGLPPPVPTSSRPALFSSISGYQSLPHPRRAHIVNTEENPQLSKSLSLEDDRSAEASPPSHSEEEPESMKLGIICQLDTQSAPQAPHYPRALQPCRVPCGQWSKGTTFAEQRVVL